MTEEATKRKRKERASKNPLDQSWRKLCVHDRLQLHKLQITVCLQRSQERLVLLCISLISILIQFQRRRAAELILHDSPPKPVLHIDLVYIAIDEGWGIRLPYCEKLWFQSVIFLWSNRVNQISFHQPNRNAFYGSSKHCFLAQTISSAAVGPPKVVSSVCLPAHPGCSEATVPLKEPGPVEVARRWFVSFICACVMDICQGLKINSSAGTVAFCSAATSTECLCSCQIIVQGDQLVDIVKLWRMGAAHFLRWWTETCTKWWIHSWSLVLTEL